jgi:hypothetical protein
MNRFWRFTSETAQSSRFNEIRSIPITTTFIKRRINTLQQPPNAVLDLVSLFKSSIPQRKNHLTDAEIVVLRKKLIRQASDSVKIRTILDDNADSLISSHSVFLQLLNQLNSQPSVLLEVLFFQFIFSLLFNFIHIYRFSILFTFIAVNFG